MPSLKSEALWAGTETSLNDYLQAVAGAQAYTQPQDTEQEDAPHLFELQGNVGVITIRGALTNRDAWYNKIFGITSYNDIREAMIHAAQHADVKHILVDIDSGGGAVSGVADTANLIRMVNDKVKPVTAFTDGTMASAAYWLGSSAGKVYASKTAMVGSIGVIATHAENSEALKKAGIGVTVMRAGKYKALANGVEPLTEDAKAQMQAHLDGAYKVFVQHVAEARNVSYDMADSQMAQGREFMGEASVGAGLVDGITAYDDLFNSISEKLIDSSNNLIDNKKNSFQQELGMGKRALSEAEIAAAAEGAGVIAAATGDVVGADGNAAGEVLEGTSQEAAATADGTAAEGEEAKPEVKADAAVTDYLQGQIKEKDSAILAAQVELARVKTELADMDAAHEGLLVIASKSVSNMQVALGGAAADLSAMSAVQVLAEHQRVSGLFSAKFKAGGVAALDAALPEKKEPAVDALAMARLNAFRNRSK